MMRTTTTIAMLCALPLYSTAAQRGAASGEVPATWTLTPDLRIGGDDDGPKSITDVRAVVATGSGSIFVLDFKVREIRLFDPSGRFVKLVARSGAGPGEISNANGMAIGASDVLWVNDPNNGRLSQYSADGSFLRQVTVPIGGYGYTWNGVVDGSDRLVDPMLGAGSGKLRRITRAGAIVDTVNPGTCTRPAAAPASLRFEGPRGAVVSSVSFGATVQSVLTPRGTRWCTPSDRYRLEHFVLGDAKPNAVVDRQVASPPVSAAERKRALDRFDSLARTVGPLVSGDISALPKVKPIIARLIADDEGRVWVRRTDTPEATPAFDVWDATGKQVAVARVAGKVGYIGFIRGSALYTVVLDEDDVPFVVRYRIAR